MPTATPPPAFTDCRPAAAASWHTESVKLERVDLGTSPDRPGWVRLAGQVRYDAPQDGKGAETYWYDFPQAHADGIAVSGDPWLACLLPVAVEIGEPLELCRPVDPLLLDHARELMGAWRQWHPARAPVAIVADVAREPVGQGVRTVCLFSGGIDSFYSVLSPHAAPIDDLMVIHGAFDLMHAAAPAFARVQGKLQSAADALGKTLIPVATNLLHTRLGRTDLMYMSQGAMMASVPLALERRFRRAIIAASIDLTWKEAWGTHPLTDALLSTSATSVESHGFTALRTEKARFVAGHDVALEALRVCLFTGDETNCMNCEKCLRTAIMLDLLGVIDKAPAFGSARLDVRKVARMAIGDPHVRHYYEEMLEICREKGRDDMARAIRRALFRSRLHDPFRPFVRWLRRHPAVRPLTYRLERLVQEPGVTRHIGT